MTTRHTAPNASHAHREEEADLVASWKAGDRRAGDRLLAHYVRELDGYFHLRVGPHRASELRQEALLRVSQAIETFRGDSSFRTFLYAIAHRTLCDHLRDRRTGRGVFDASHCSLEEVLGDAAVEPDFDGDSRALWAALRALPVRQQELLTLRVIHGFTYKEIAEIVEVGSPVTLRTSVHAAYAKLRAMLGVPGGRHRGVTIDRGALRPRLGARLRWLAALISAVLAGPPESPGTKDVAARA